jgi:phosphatidylglycerophosphate synthase
MPFPDPFELVAIHYYAGIVNQHERRAKRLFDGADCFRLWLSRFPHRFRITGQKAIPGAGTWRLDAVECGPMRGGQMHIQANQMHTREHTSLLAEAERRLLVRMAARMPKWVTPDHLSLLGLGAMLLAGAAYWASSWNRVCLLVVVFALALNWFGDSLDGTLARVRNSQRPRYGYYVDHVIDLIGTFFLIGGLALSGFMSPLLALGMLVAYQMVAAEVYLATHVRGVFRLAFLRVGPTELRIILAFGTLMLFRNPWVHLGGAGRFLLFDVGGVVSIAGMAFTLAVSAVRNTRALYKAEPLPR